MATRRIELWKDDAFPKPVTYAPAHTGKDHATFHSLSLLINILDPKYDSFAHLGYKYHVGQVSSTLQWQSPDVLVQAVAGDGETSKV